MKPFVPAAAFSSLGQDRRLEIFRLLVGAEPDGMNPSAMLQPLGNPPSSSLSSHLSILTNAGLITRQRKSREIIYRANMDHVRALMLFLIVDCCGGEADLSEPMLLQLLPALAEPAPFA